MYSKARFCAVPLDSDFANTSAPSRQCQIVGTKRSSSSSWAIAIVAISVMPYC